MKDQLQETVLKLLSWVEDGALWMGGQIPIYIDELLKWGVVKASIYISVGLLSAVLGIILGNMVLKCAKEVVEETKGNSRGAYKLVETDAFFTACVIYVLTFLISSPIIIYNTLIVLKIIVAPRVWLIDYLRELV